MLKQAVILAGGPGLRLRPFTADRPKPMVLVAGRPFVDYLLEFLRNNGIEEVILLLGYLPEKITEYVGDGGKFGLRVRYSITPLEDGTGTRIKKAKKLLADEFLLMYCDNLLNFRLQDLYDFQRSRGVLATVTVYTNKHGLTKNNIFVDENGLVTKYDKSRQDPNMNGVDMGFFVLKKKVVDLIPEEQTAFFESTAMPRLIEQRQLAGFTVDRPYYSIGSPARMEITSKFLTPKKVIFLDRDGVINKRPPVGDYVKNWGEFEFLPDAIEALRLLSENGYMIFIVSNQAGIARGKMSEDDLVDIHRRMEEELRKHGVTIQAIYYCPHAWDAGCECRKPKPGMFFRAALEHFVHLPDAVFVGDDPRDEEAGNAAGVKTILVESGKSLLTVVKELIR